MSLLSLIGNGLESAGRGIANGVNRWVDYSSMGGMQPYMQSQFPDGIPPDVKQGLRRGFIQNLGMALAGQNPAAVGELQRETAANLLQNAIRQKELKQFQQFTATPTGGIDYYLAAQWNAAHGNSEAAARYAKMAEDARNGEATRAEQEIKSAQAQMALAGQLLGNTTNQQEYTTGLDTLRGFGINLTLPKDFSPDFVKKLAMSSMAFKDQLSAGIAQSAEERAQAGWVHDMSNWAPQDTILRNNAEASKYVPEAALLNKVLLNQQVTGTQPPQPIQMMNFNEGVRQFNATFGQNAARMGMQAANEAHVLQTQYLNTIGQMRRELVDRLNPHTQRAAGFQQMMSGVNGGMGDLAVIYGYMKMLDPLSVVREGEFETARKTQAIPDWVWGAYERVRGGGIGLDQQTRNRFIQAGGGLVKQYADDIKQIMGYYTDLANRNGVNPQDLVVGDPYANATNSYNDWWNKTIKPGLNPNGRVPGRRP